VSERWWKITKEIDMKKLLITFLFLFSSNAYCDWLKVTESDSLVVYIEPSTVKKFGQSVRVWSLYNFLNSREFEKRGTYKSFKSYDEYNCSEDKSKNLSILFFSGDMGEGNNIYINDKGNDWRYQSPGSIGLSLLKYSCGLK